MPQVAENSPTSPTAALDAGDVLYGATEICAFVSTLFARPIPRRRIYNWVDSGRLPVGKFGGNLMGSKRRIREAISRCVAGE